MSVPLTKPLILLYVLPETFLILKKFFLDHPKIKAGPKVTFSMSLPAQIHAAKPLSLLPLKITELPLNPSKNSLGCLSRFSSFPFYTKSGYWVLHFIMLKGLHPQGCR